MASVSRLSPKSFIIKNLNERQERKKNKSGGKKKNFWKGFWRKTGDRGYVTSLNMVLSIICTVLYCCNDSIQQEGGTWLTFSV